MISKDEFIPHAAPPPQRKWTRNTRVGGLGPSWVDPDCEGSGLGEEVLAANAWMIQIRTGRICSAEYYSQVRWILPISCTHSPFTNWHLSTFDVFLLNLTAVIYISCIKNGHRIPNYRSSAKEWRFMIGNFNPTLRTTRRTSIHQFRRRSNSTKRLKVRSTDEGWMPPIRFRVWHYECFRCHHGECAKSAFRWGRVEALVHFQRRASSSYSWINPIELEVGLAKWIFNGQNGSNAGIK